jgi:hypothetical protein
MTEGTGRRKVRGGEEVLPFVRMTKKRDDGKTRTENTNEGRFCLVAKGPLPSPPRARGREPTFPKTHHPTPKPSFVPNSRFLTPKFSSTSAGNYSAPRGVFRPTPDGA